MADIDGFRLPTWRGVLERDYRPWDSDRLVIDTAAGPPAKAADAILAAALALSPPAAPTPGGSASPPTPGSRTR